MNRRHFIQSTAFALSGFPLISNTKSAHRAIGANDRIRIAVAGLNSRGKSHINGFLGQKNVEIAYVIDPDKQLLSRTVESLKGRGQKNIKGVTEVRTALEDKDVDALTIATPNHWHSLMTIWGAQSGKHVYVEKPMSHDVFEGRIAVAAQQKYGVVIQHGTQQRSDASRAGLHEQIKAGKWGRLKISYGYCCKPRGSIGHKNISPPPAHLDWNLWKGPAVIEKFHGNYVHYNWHWFWATGNGDLNNQGTHQLDVARWAIDDDQTHPVRTMAIGGRYQWKDQGETPNSMFGMAEYANGQQVFFNVRNVNYKGYKRQVENQYYFEDGGRIIGKSYYPKGSDKGEKIEFGKGKVTPGGTWGSFIAACRAGKPEMANGNVKDAHYGCVLGHLINNSYRLGKKVPFNQKAGHFEDNKEASEHFGKLHEIMGKGVGIPEKDNTYTVGPWLTFDAKKERHTGEYADDANELLQDTNNAEFKVPELSDV